MRAAALISGGKDSALALHRAMKEGISIEYLVTMIPHREDSWMFHYPNVHMTKLFAEAAGIPLVERETSGVKDEELEDLRMVLATLDIEAVVSGAIASIYQKQRIQKICRKIGLKSITPLWKQNPLKLLNEIVDLGFQALIVGVYAHGFTEDWLGRQLDHGTVEDLLDLNRRYHVSIVGEGGEYETLVVDAPYFEKKIELVETERVWNIQSGSLVVKKARLTQRQGSFLVAL